VAALIFEHCSRSQIHAPSKSLTPILTSGVEGCGTVMFWWVGAIEWDVYALRGEDRGHCGVAATAYWDHRRRVVKVWCCGKEGMRKSRVSERTRNLPIPLSLRAMQLISNSVFEQRWFYATHHYRCRNHLPHCSIRHSTKGQSSIPQRQGQRHAVLSRISTSAFLVVFGPLRCLVACVQPIEACVAMGCVTVRICCGRF
jgi:hypothetical protein